MAAGAAAGRTVIVIDASVLVNALVDDTATGSAAMAALEREDRWAGPEHLVVEVAAAVRGLWLGRRIAGERAEAAVGFLVEAEIARVDTRPLLAEIWQLRHVLTAYDAVYVAASRALDVPLLTADAALAAAATGWCAVLAPGE